MQELCVNRSLTSLQSHDRQNPQIRHIKDILLNMSGLYQQQVTQPRFAAAPGNGHVPHGRRQ